MSQESTTTSVESNQSRALNLCSDNPKNVWQLVKRWLFSLPRWLMWTNLSGQVKKQSQTTYIVRLIFVIVVEVQGVLRIVAVHLELLYKPPRAMGAREVLQKTTFSNVTSTKTWGILRPRRSRTARCRCDSRTSAAACPRPQLLPSLTLTNNFDKTAPLNSPNDLT